MKALNLRICGTWKITNYLLNNTVYKNGLDIIDNFQKFYYCYLLKNKTMDIFISKKSFINFSVLPRNSGYYFGKMQIS